MKSWAELFLCAEMCAVHHEQYYSSNILSGITLMRYPLEPGYDTNNCLH
jgi:hypothetical protein